MDNHIIVLARSNHPATHVTLKRIGKKSVSWFGVCLIQELTLNVSTLDEKRLAAEGFGKLAFRDNGDDDKGLTNAPIERAEMKLRVSADGEQNEYSYVSADFGAHISGDMQWTGKVQEVKQEDMRFGTVFTEYGFSILLMKCHERSFFDMAVMAQAGRSRALIIYHDDPDVRVYMHAGLL